MAVHHDTADAVHIFLGQIRDKSHKDVYAKAATLARKNPEKVLAFFENMPAGWLAVGDPETGTPTGKLAVFLLETAQDELSRREAQES